MMMMMSFETNHHHQSPPPPPSKNSPAPPHLPAIRSTSSSANSILTRGRGMLIGASANGVNGSGLRSNNGSPVHHLNSGPAAAAAANSSLPNTPNFVRKFHSNFRPLDLRKLTLSGTSSSNGSGVHNNTNSNGSGSSSGVVNYDDSSSSTSLVSSPSSALTSTSSSQDSSPRTRYFGSAHSHDSFILKRQSSQNRLRESLLASLLLSPRTKEIEFTVPQTLSPLTPTFGRKGLAAAGGVGNSGESSPAGSLSGSRSETDPSTSRANTPSPIFFRGSGSDIAGACVGAALCGLNPELYKSTKTTGEDSSDDDQDEDDEHCEDQNYYGHVKFALEYDTTNEKLLVTRIKARNLVTKNLSPNSSRGSGGSCSSASYSNNGTCNPFVRVSLFPDERRTLQSKPKELTRNPRFHEVFGFQISRVGLDERSLKLCFYDVDQNRKHSMLGYLIQPLKDIDWSFGKQVFKQDLLRDIGELSPNIGEVLVSLCYNGNISRLTVTLFEARGIKTSESASGLYAKISFSQHTKVIKTKKTSTVTLLGCRSDFNESFNFKLPAELLDTASVSIQLMYAQPGYNKDQTAGRIVLGSFMFARGKGLDHWTEMLSKQKEQIQYWHAVNE